MFIRFFVFSLVCLEHAILSMVLWFHMIVEGTGIVDSVRLMLNDMLKTVKYFLNITTA